MMLTSNATAPTAKTAAATATPITNLVRSGGRLAGSLVDAIVNLPFLRMSDRTVAANAAQRPGALRVGRIDRFADFLVAIAAAAFGDLPISRRNANRLVKPSGGECPGVARAVRRFIEILCKKSL